MIMIDEKSCDFYGEFLQCRSRQRGREGEGRRGVWGGGGGGGGRVSWGRISVNSEVKDDDECEGGREGVMKDDDMLFVFS